jgi:hypothetical protein
MDVGKLLKAGRNEIAIEGENRPASVPANPAGLIAGLRIGVAGAKEISIRSDASWRTAKEVVGSDWTYPDFDDTRWIGAKELGPYGCEPWGNIGTQPGYGPFAIGNDTVRLIYVPELRSVRLQNLDARYRAKVFNPVSGNTTDLGNVAADATINAPIQTDAEDWVLIIERAR